MVHDGWSLAWGTGPDDVGLVVWSPSASAEAAWLALAAGRRDDDALRDRATAALGDRAGAFIAGMSFYVGFIMIGVVRA